MILRKIRNWLLSPWKLTLPLCTTALLATVPILFPFSSTPSTQQFIRDICGGIILLSTLGSILHVICSGVYYFLKLQNVRAIAQIVAWCALWVFAGLMFMRLAEIADVPSPYVIQQTERIQQTDELHDTSELIAGPAALSLPIYPPAVFSGTNLIAAPHISLLEQEHADLLGQYLSTAPRWAFATHDDTFYTKPGHPVMVTPTDGGVPGMVHATFRTVTTGSPLPDGYLELEPGAEIPPATEEEKNVPDLAIDLGGKRYLLLAWRGVNSREKAFKAINTTIATIDAELAPLAKNPTPETIRKMTEGKTTIKGTEPILSLAEIAPQFGIYQGEFFANPGKKGTFIVVIRELKTGQLLHIFTLAAQYSDNKNELFRHDIPAGSNITHGYTHKGYVPDAFAPHAPFFVMKEGESHQYFGISVEVLFSEDGSDGAITERIIRRCYNVHAFENISVEQPPTPAAPALPSGTTPPTIQIDTPLPPEAEEPQADPAPTTEQTPTPSPAVEPAPAPETQPEATPATQEPQTEPAPTTEQTPPPSPAVEPAPATETQPEATPATQEPQTEPAPTTEQTPAPAPAVEPAPAPETQPEATPATQEPQQEPAPTTEQTPAPAPAVEPAPATETQPEATPATQEPQTEPAPTTEQTLAPTPAVEPAPATEEPQPEV